MIWRCLLAGGRAARSFWSLAVLLYLGNLLVMAGVVWILAWILSQSADSSLGLASLVSGYNATVFSDLAQQGISYGRMVMGGFLVAAPLGVILTTTLSGGTIAVLAARQSRWSFWTFLAASIAYAGRFLRLLLLGMLLLLALGAAIVLILIALLAVAGWVPETEKEVLEIVGAGAGSLLFFAIVVWTALDYARLWMVHSEARSSRQALMKAFRFIGTHPVAAGAIQLAGITMVVLVAGAQLLFGIPWKMGTLEGVLAVVLVHQGAVLLRTGIRLGMIASQLTLVTGLTPPIEARTETSG